MKKKHSWKVNWQPSRKIPAGIASIWQFNIIAGENILPGAILRFIPDYSRITWTIGEFYFSTEAECHLENRIIYQGMGRSPLLEGEVKEGMIRKGARIQLILGNYSGNGQETFAPKFAYKNASVTLQIKPSRRKDFITVAEIPLQIVPGETRQLNLRLISPTDKNSSVYLSAVDEFANLTTEFKNDANIFFLPSSGRKRKFTTLSVRRGISVMKGLEKLKGHFPILLFAQSPDKKISGQKEIFYPGFLEDINKNIYFGEMHLHCNGSDDGLHSPSWVYHYARNVAGLGFCSITDHAYHLIGNDSWERERIAARKANVPGEFVTFLGYEYDGWYKKGHIGVHFKDDVPEVIVANSYTALWRKLKKSGYDFFTCPHHPNGMAEHLPLEKVNAWRNYDWSYHDDDIQPLAEIFQERGSFEKEEIGERVVQGGHGSSLQSALSRGYHIGFFGGSDSHIGRPGIPSGSGWLMKTCDVRAGITAVIAGNLDRNSLWKALKSRNTYVTTGARILLDVRVDDLIMGERKLLKKKKQIPIRVRGAGPEKIIKVEIIKNGRIFQEFSPNSRSFDINTTDKKFCFSMPCLNNGKKSLHTYYYVRITQKDSHMAWSSPIFLCLER